MKYYLLFLFFLCSSFFGGLHLSAQTVIYSSSFDNQNSDGPQDDNSGAIDISNCTSISFSVDYSCSLAWEGSGNLEHCNECIGAGSVPCDCDPNTPTSIGCNACWDFLWVRFNIDGTQVGGDLIGGTNTTDAEQFGTITTTNNLTNSSAASVDIRTQTWGSTEAINGTVMVICTQALAVELVEFTANLENKQALLKWTTASETNHDRFEVEHSTDGQIFKKIETIDNKGDATTRQDYQFVHQNPVEGNNYYRLRVMDLNDKAEYSSIKTVFYQLSEEGILVYPVPTENLLNIDFGKANNIEKQITLIHSNGQVIKRIDVAESTDVFELSLKNMPSGIYWIKVVMDTEIVTQKIIKQ